MMVFWRLSPPSRCFPARGKVPAVALGLVLSTACGAALAQTSSALQAADPDTATPTVALVLPAMGSAKPEERPADLARAREIWQRANERVAEFPRGHVDLLRWEASNPGDTPAANSATPARMDLAQALRMSLRQRPDLFTHATMNALEQGAVQVAYAKHLRELQRAWIDAVAARQRWRVATEMWEATRTGSELGRRMVVAGNWSQAKLMREQLTQSGAWQTAVDAQSSAHLALERLAQMLGVWDAQGVAQLGDRLPESLPAVPQRVSPGAGVTEATLEAAVLRGHPLLSLQRTEATRELAARNPGRRQDWNAAVEASLAALPDPGSSPVAPHIGDLSLLRDHPLERANDAEAALLRAASERRSMARQAWAQLQARHASALHAQDVVAQLQTALEQETLLRYNGMLQSSWELLASARERMQSLDAALQARRDHWRAQADMQALLAGADYAGPDSSSNAGAGSTAAPAGH